MSDLIDQTKAASDAVTALTHRIRAMEPDTDPEAVAAEFMTALCGQGWRKTAAAVPPSWRPQPGAGAAPNEEWRRIRAEMGGDREPA